MKPSPLARALALVLLSAAVSGPAAAQQSRLAFTTCDGYGAPGGNTDGMLAAATRWGGILGPGAGQGDGDQNRIRVGGGEAQCDAALADPTLLPAFWARRVNLLRAKAFHQLADRDFTGALATFDRAEAAAPNRNEVFYRRSLKVGIDLGRAQALLELGRVEESRTLALAAWAARPFHRGTTFVTLAVLGPGAPAADRERLLKRLSALSPDYAEQVYRFLVDEARWSDVVAAGPNAPPRQYDLTQYPTAGQRAYYGFHNSADSDTAFIANSGPYAYALAATGHPAEARAAMDAAESRRAAAVEALAPPPPPTTREQRRAAAEKKRRSPYEYGLQLDASRAKALTEFTAMSEYVESWRHIVEARLLLTEGKADEAIALLKTGRPPGSRAALDVVVLALKARPDDAWLRALALELNEELKRRSVGLYRAVSVPMLFLLIPEAETRESSLTYNQTLASWADIRGAFGRGAAGQGTFGVNSGTATMGMVEEGALLAAAAYAQTEGAPAFIVRSRSDVKRYEVQSYGQAPDSGVPMGMTSSLTIDTVRSDGPPRQGLFAPWREIRVAEVYAALAPAYGEGAAVQWPH